MAKAVVLLFLLDSLPDFNNVTNTTLRTLIPSINGTSCDPNITDPVLKVVNRKLGLTDDSVERILDMEKANGLKPIYVKQDSPEAPYNIGTVFDDSIQGSNEKSFEKTSNFIEGNDIQNVINEENISDCEIPSTDFFKSNGSSINSKVVFPESAPFSAAIFETVSNVTAQTCGGALLSPNWVLTAASCINVLSPFYTNSSHETLQNSYTVIIGAKNPLKDGTVHNVTEVLLHPTPKIISNPPIHHSLVHQNQALIRQLFNVKLRPVENVKAPSLALMRIEPGLAEGMVPVMENRTSWDGVNARVYGWALVQNESGHDVMLATSLPVQMLSPTKCKSVYGIIEHNSTLCLSMNETAGNTTRMNSGGPVVIIQDGRVQLLGVALTDSMTPLLASPLTPHRDWLRKIIGTTV